MVNAKGKKTFLLPCMHNLPEADASYAMIYATHTICGLQGHGCLTSKHQNLSQGQAYIWEVHRLQDTRHAIANGC